MLRIALTGGIATGKSYVLRRLGSAGIPTIDADALVHAALRDDAATISAVGARFGSAVVAADGAIDRQALGAIVFDDPRARADLEAILHPTVYRLIHDWFASLGRRSAEQAPDVAVADIPLLFETHHEGDFDRVIVVACPAAAQIERLIARSGIGEADARKRLAAQWPIGEKSKRADYVIDTGGTFEETDAQVDRVIEELKGPRSEARPST